VLMMLRSPSRNWRDTDAGKIIMNQAEREGIPRLCLGIMKQSMPVESIGLDAFATHNSRLRVADAFEAALKTRPRAQWSGTALLLLLGGVTFILVTIWWRRSQRKNVQ
jgi:hypothetical protein